ncbi:hypothetical protein MMC13_000712 [Lambiella insularis]|nr:hypothetical protein [Lambiella insularis]
MESSKAALRHLYAAIQVLRRSEPQLSPTDLMNMVPIYDVILRFDFLAMKLVPFASSSFSRCPTLAYRELPSWFRQPNDFSPSPHLDHQDRRLFPKSSTITTERHRLIQLVSGHNKLSRVVWGPWYSTSERPSRDELMSYYSDMLVWKATSPETFGSCVSDLDSQCASTVEEVDLLPIPPKPLSFTSDEAAVNMVMYNGFLGCALAMLSTTDPDPLAREIESFNSVYQNLRICSGLLYKCEGQETDEYAYKPCDCLDTGISMFLYHGTPRCFSTDWQQWTMTALHSIGREGLLNAHAFANTLEIMAQLESVSSQNVLSKNSILATKSSLGRICDRLVPVVMPKGEEGGYLAYFLRYGATEENSDESLIRIVGLANWRQDDEGGMLGLEIDSAVRGTASLDELGNMNIIEAWREKVEAGWHRLV